LLVGRSGARRGVQAEAGFAHQKRRVDDHAGAPALKHDSELEHALPRY
jgi:hypothetical protein